LGRRTSPDFNNSGTMRFAMFTGTAKPTPAEAPDGERICELIPIMRPCESSKGPPEFPGLIDASV